MGRTAVLTYGSDVAVWPSASLSAPQRNVCTWVNSRSRESAL